MQSDDQIQEILLSEINLDRDTQIRVAMNEETVQRYFDIMEDESAFAKFPPILLYRDFEGKLWLADGHHRVAAAMRRKFATTRAIVRTGTKSDAVWEAAKANGRNGLQLGRADIRRAVEMLCAAWPDRSNVVIAETLGCDEKTVRKYRPAKSGSDLSEPEKRVGKDSKSYSVKRKEEEFSQPNGDDVDSEIDRSYLTEFECTVLDEINAYLESLPPEQLRKIQYIIRHADEETKENLRKNGGDAEINNVYDKLIGCDVEPAPESPNAS